MIYSLSGVLSDVLDGSIVIDCCGVGYEVIVPTTVSSRLPGVGESLRIYTYHYIREDQQLLFGFVSDEDKRFFILLTSVSGIGPKVGVKIMSYLTSQQLTQAILEENIGVLIDIPGVGKKVAERLVVELKDKVSKLFSSSFGVSIQGHVSSPSLSTSVSQDLILALKTLGYHQDEIKKAISLASSELSTGQNLEASIKVLLKHIS
jgi:Holliday junction DNA helicase RuvA